MLRLLRFLCPIIVSASVMFFVFPLVGHVSAVEVRTRDVTISREEYIDDDLFLFGGDVKMDGTVTGDLVASGDSIEVTGSVGGDVYLAGGEVLVTGDIAKTLFVVGGRVKLSGVTQRNVYLAGGQLLVSSDAYSMEDVLALGGQIDLDGWVGDDLWVSGGNLNIRSKVEDDLIASGGMVRANKDNVTGDYRVSWGQTGSDWRWLGRTTEEVQQAAARSFAVDVLSRMLLYVGMLGAGLALIKFAPIKTDDVAYKIGSSVGEFVWSLAVGLLLTAAAPIAIVLLAVSVVGLPVAVLVAGLLVFLFLFGSLWVDMAIGRRIIELFSSRPRGLFAALVVGSLVRAVVTLLPCVGLIYTLVTFWAVVGAAVRMKIEKVEVARAWGIDSQIDKMAQAVNADIGVKPAVKHMRSNKRRRQ